MDDKDVRIADLQAELIQAYKTIFDLQMALRRQNKEEPPQWDGATGLKLQAAGYSLAQIAEYFGYSKKSKNMISQLLTEARRQCNTHM